MQIIKRLIQFISNSAYLLLTMAVFFWASNFIIGRSLRMDISPVALAFWRWFVASLFACLLSYPYLKTDIPRIIRHWPIILLLSFLGVTVFNTLIYMGLQHTVAVNGLLMQSIMPIIIVVISFSLFKEKLRLVQFAGVALSLLGALTIISKGSLEIILQLRVNKGDIYIFIAVLCYGLYSVLLRKRPSIHPLSFISTTFMLGTLMLGFIFFLEKPIISPLEMKFETLCAITYVAIFPSIISFLCFNRGVELIGPNRAGIFIHLIPLFGSIMAIVFLGESLQLYHAAGIVCIASGIFLTTRTARTKLM